MQWDQKIKKTQKKYKQFLNGMTILLNRVNHSMFLNNNLVPKQNYAYICMCVFHGIRLLRLI